MWRFIIATFAFLGWSFYSLSGGADYQPKEGSRQAEARKQPAESAGPAAIAHAMPAAAPKLAPLPDPASGPETPPETLRMASMVNAGATIGAFGNQPLDKTVRASAATAPPQDPDRWTATLNLAQPATPTDVDQIIQTAASQEREISRDIRKITAGRVNYRNGPGTRYGVLGKLSRGDEVEVLEVFENGWVRLRIPDSNRIGWVAGSLVSGGDG